MNRCRYVDKAKGGFTFETLAALAASIPKTQPWRYVTLTPEFFDRLTHDPAFKSDSIPRIGIEIYVKHGQVAAAWAFNDKAILRRYLDGRLREAELIEQGISCERW